VGNVPELLIAFLGSALLTFLDLDRTFYIPTKASDRTKLYAWWWGFILGNGGVAGTLYLVVRDTGGLSGLHPWLLAGIVGISFPAIIRTKFTTITVQGKEVPLGLEPSLYINRELRPAGFSAARSGRGRGPPKSAAGARQVPLHPGLQPQRVFHGAGGRPGEPDGRGHHRSPGPDGMPPRAQLIAIRREMKRLVADAYKCLAGLSAGVGCKREFESSIIPISTKSSSASRTTTSPNRRFPF
jgi:hypothetical protein